MTKSKGIGRGGLRPGSGRPPKGPVPEKKLSSEVSKIVRTLSVATVERGSRAAALLDKAYATLEDVMDNSPFPAPRVSAAMGIVKIAMLEASAGEGAGKDGKKVQAAKAATTAGVGTDWGDDLSPANAIN